MSGREQGKYYKVLEGPGEDEDHPNTVYLSDAAVAKICTGVKRKAGQTEVIVDIRTDSDTELPRNLEGKRSALRKVQIPLPLLPEAPRAGV